MQQDLLRRLKKGATPLLCAKQVVVGKGAVVLDQRIVAVALQVAVRFAICIHITDKSKYRELLLKAGEVIAVNRIADAGKGQQVLTQEVQTADRQLGLRQRESDSVPYTAPSSSGPG